MEFTVNNKAKEFMNNIPQKRRLLCSKVKTNRVGQAARERPREMTLSA